MTTREQLQETLCDRLFWHTAERDDARVADYLYHHREMDVVYAMDEVTPRRDSTPSLPICRRSRSSRCSITLIHKNNREKMFYSSNWCLSF